MSEDIELLFYVIFHKNLEDVVDVDICHVKKYTEMFIISFHFILMFRINWPV